MPRTWKLGLIMAILAVPCAAQDISRRDSGRWKVSVEHPRVFRKGERVCVRVDFDSDYRVRQTEKVRVRVRLMEKDLLWSQTVAHEEIVRDRNGRRRIKKIGERVFEIETPAGAAAHRTIRGRAVWHCTLSDYEAIGAVELYVRITVENIGSTRGIPGFGFRGYSGKKRIIKVKRAGEAPHGQGCDCDDCER